jgi:hypothetical protein
MENDSLKNFIEDNKSQFELEMPSDKVWKGIQKAQKPKYNSWLLWSSIAASVIMVFGLSFYYLKTNDLKTQIAQEVKLDPIQAEVMEMEVYYASQIESKVAEAKKYEDTEVFLEEVDFLKEEYQELKKEMDLGANREVVLEAMIDNYKVRLQILEDLLSELKEEKNDLQHEKGI